MINALDIANAVNAHDKAGNPLVALIAEGQSVWLDNLTRQIVRGSELKALIEEDGLRNRPTERTKKRPVRP